MQIGRLVRAGSAKRGAAAMPAHKRHNPALMCSPEGAEHDDGEERNNANVAENVPD